MRYETDLKHKILEENFFGERFFFVFFSSNDF